MNREKYVNDTSYREGYTDGYREGVNAVISMYENNVQKFVDDFTKLNNKLIELRVRTAEPQEREDKNDR